MEFLRIVCFRVEPDDNLFVNHNQYDKKPVRNVLLLFIFWGSMHKSLE